MEQNLLQVTYVFYDKMAPEESGDEMGHNFSWTLPEDHIVLHTFTYQNIIKLPN